jgi:hypothetical protein
MSNKSVCPPWWSEVWIVAAGHSACDFDFDRLAGKTVIVINDACHHPTLAQRRAASEVTLFSADPDWVGRHLGDLEYWPGPRYVCVALDTNPHLADIPRVTYLERFHFFGLSENPAALCTGGNSGYAAINLAWLKHAMEIHLVGYDMDPSTRGMGDKFTEWIPRFRTMIPQLGQRGVRVINHNRNSFIDAFEFAV